MRPNDRPRPLGEFRIEGEGLAPEANQTVVRLFPEPDKAFTPAHIVVNKDAEVEFLAARAQILWREDKESID